MQESQKAEQSQIGEPTQLTGLPFKVEAVNQMKTLSDSVQKLLQQRLESETIAIMEAQTAECKLFKQQVMEKAQKINAETESLKAMISNSHDESLEKSFMKSELKEYLSTLSKIDDVKLQELLQSDLKICEHALENAKQNVVAVSENYLKIFKKFQAELMEAGQASEKIIFCDTARFQVVHSQFTSRASHGNYGLWDDNPTIGDISRASKIRMGVKTLLKGNQCRMFFAEENDKQSKGINYCMDGYGSSDWNYYGYRKPYVQNIADSGDYYRGDVLIKDKTCWFEFEISREKQEMQISLMKNEKGEGKKFMQKWPLKDHKPNWLMFVTAHGEQAVVTTYIINGSPSDQELDDYFNSRAEEN